MISAMHVTALMGSERSGTGRPMILEVVCLILVSLFLLDTVSMEKNQGRQYKRMV